MSHVELYALHLLIHAIGRESSIVRDDSVSLMQLIPLVVNHTLCLTLSVNLGTSVLRIVLRRLGLPCVIKRN